MYTRDITDQLLDSIRNYPVLTLLGPRQSGKTTLVRKLFQDFEYYSLEDPDIREMASEDPRGFLNQKQNNMILDEVQRVPKLTSYLQSIVDQPDCHRKFILTGSNSTLLTDSITQTLAGRTELFTLHPLTVNEISTQNPDLQLNDYLYSGGYPRIYDAKLNPTKWLKSYFQLYVEKDIRLISNIANLDLFEKFVKLVAGRAGQLINASSLANEIGVSSPTITGWISALKSTFICFSLQPHFRNFNKRIVKTPKLYFHDTGMLCYLLGINNKDQLDIHPLRGNIFENFIISEIIKNKTNNGEALNYYFWRDQKGHEIDLIEDKFNHLFPVEIKMSSTFNSSFIKNTEFLNELQKNSIANHDIQGEIIYTGNQERVFKNIQLRNWFQLLKDRTRKE
jgi:predicted AAA+ superfamily ATPase